MANRHREKAAPLPQPSPLAVIIADPAARARWIAWRVRLHARKLQRAARAPFRTCRGIA